jgi:CBS domain-containing protein
MKLSCHGDLHAAKMPDRLRESGEYIMRIGKFFELSPHRVTEEQHAADRRSPTWNDDHFCARGTTPREKNIHEIRPTITTWHESSICSDPARSRFPPRTKELRRMQHQGTHSRSDRDFHLGFNFFDDADADETPISEIMTKKVFCATPDMPLEALAHVMLDQEIGGTPVVDDSDRPIGVITKTDLLRELEDFDSCTVLDAMTPIVYWLPEDACISQAAALMAYEHVHSIPVVSKAGRITGIVSTLDILRWFARRRGFLIPK